MPSHKGKKEAASEGSVVPYLIACIVLLLAVSVAGWYNALTAMHGVQPRPLPGTSMGSPRVMGKEQAVCQAYRAMEPRSPNPKWIAHSYTRQEALRASMLIDLDRTPDQELLQRFERWETFLDDSGSSPAWKAHLDSTTPAAFHGGRNNLNCRDPDTVAIDMRRTPWTHDTALHVVERLRECGFVQLRGFFDRSLLERFRESFNAFRASKEALQHFRYPCQGEGRVEFMLPFAEPFNSSIIHQDSRLHDVLFNFLMSRFKLELMTVINSLGGSGNQRWHQGWRYLWHPEERTPPYAVVVGVPLVDVTTEMGPTQFCPRKKMRFYQAYACSGDPFSMPSELGDMILFDYKTLHRGPANRTPLERPMVSMVFSSLFFLNSEAIVNRGISLVQTLHQRRYWESYFWHPDENAYFRV